MEKYYGRIEKKALNHNFLNITNGNQIDIRGAKSILKNPISIFTLSKEVI
jgi:hypothetical protein